MATVIIARDDAGDNQLPEVCMRCGQPASTIVRRRFAWHPGWVIWLVFVGILVYVIVAVCLTKRMRLLAPMCEDHKKHWYWRSLIMVGGLLALIVLIIAAATISEEKRALDDQTMTYVWSGVAGFGFVWLVTVAILHGNAIRPREITDDEMTLIGVAPEFRDAMEEDRASPPLEEKPTRRRLNDPGW